ncbi:torsin-1A-like [Triplophysa dalaica]|uniref:torsin-1A-like n=1 Tax=Triplophysa dalaica TaxID=1582913 RepID=UPI0024DFC0B4|nr:torsin-1A-like [Triplophysa dalaica]
MKSEKLFVLFLLLPMVTVETGVFDFFNGFFGNVGPIDSKIDTVRPFDSKEFMEDLRKSLFGQHIALETILKAVTWFMKNPDPPKPLALSLHGPTGVGKSYVMKIIARNIYEMGEKSKHIHTFIASYHFYNNSEVAIYKAQLKEWIYGNVSRFSRSMFVFDEMDQMNPHLIDTIKPFLEYIPHLDGVSFNNAIFIFLSQAGANVITNVALDFWRKGKEREELQMNTLGMETQIYQAIFNNKESGFWHSCLIDHHLVDHFIPFLPLERKHVKQCVLAEMTNHNITDSDVIDKVFKDIPFFPDEEKIFSIKGCKTVNNKLGLHVELD